MRELGCLKEPDMLYIAYFSNTKQMVAHTHDKMNLENYLFKTDLYDRVTIFESNDKRFNDAIYFEYWSYRLIKKDYLDQSFICTDREYDLLRSYMCETRHKINEIINDMRYLVNVLDLEEKELNKIFKTTKLLYNIMNNHESCRLLPKGSLDNKTLRRLMEMEDDMKGTHDGVEDFFYRYNIILI